MTHPTPPKQYFVTCDHSLVDTGRAPDDADGFFMFADEALAYANELAKHMLDKAVKIIGRHEEGFRKAMSKSLSDEERNHYYAIAEALGDAGVEVQELKEGV